MACTREARKKKDACLLQEMQKMLSDIDEELLGKFQKVQMACKVRALYQHKFILQMVADPAAMETFRMYLYRQARCCIAK